MNNAQDMSPDFVLMRLVSAAEYDRLDEDNLMSAAGVVSGFGKAVLGHHGNNINNGFEFDPNNPTAGPTHQGNPSPHYSSQLESRLEALDSGVMLTRPPASDGAPPPPDFAVAQRFDFPHGVGRGSRAQLMVFQNLLRSSDGILECGLDPPGFQVSDAEKQEASPVCVTTATTTTGEHITNCSADLQQHKLQWHPMLKLSQVVADELPAETEGGGLCHRHQIVPDTLDWPPILDFSLLDPRRACPPGGEGEKTPRGKSRKGGSLKFRLSKLFRTKSSSGSSHLLDKRPSLASSTSSGGSLVDVWGSTCSSTDQDAGSRLLLSRPQSAFSSVPFSPAFTGETVSLVDVDISRRGVSSLHPPTPPPPPRRSLSLLDDFGGPLQPGPFLERSAGASMQSLPPRPLLPSLSTIQHSLSLNDTFLRGLPRPVPLPGAGPPSSRLHQRPMLCPLSRPDASSFATSLRELEKCGWYWGPMNWEDAEMKLKAKPDGSFLVRDSSDPRYILSLSFRSQGVTHHTRMEHYRGTFSLWCHPKFEDRCHSVVEFIERAIMHSKNGKFLYFLRSRVPGLPPTPVQLLYPVSRFSSVKSLQHLCRFCIRQQIRIDHIQELPLPTPLIIYLRKFYYYDPEEEMYLSIKDTGRGQTTQEGVASQT